MQKIDKKIFGVLLLILTAMIWGCSFVAQSVGMDYMQPFTFNSVRLLLAGTVLIPFILVRDGIRKKQIDTVPDVEGSANNEPKVFIVGGIICGLILFAASNLQQFGLSAGTSSGKAGFITAFYILLVPLCGLFMKKKVRPLIWVCVFLALAGLYFLCINASFEIASSDIYVFLCAFGYTAHIIAIDKYSPLTDGVKLSCIQFFTAGAIGIICMFIFEKPDINVILSAWPLIVYAGAFSGGIAFTLQIVAQKYVQPTVASLLMSLESVFSVIFSAILLGQLPSLRELAGCILMFAAIIISQLPQREKHKEKRI